MPHEMESTDSNYGPVTVFMKLEHGVYTALGALIGIVAIVALAHAGVDVVSSVLAFNDADRVFKLMDELLFVLMLVEILHTVRVSIRSRSLNAEPFLIVGLIATIRRVLVITLESSKVVSSSGAVDCDAMFRHSMSELGVLGILILVMVGSIFLLRKSAPETNPR